MISWLLPSNNASNTLKSLYNIINIGNLQFSVILMTGTDEGTLRTIQLVSVTDPVLTLVTCPPLVTDTCPRHNVTLATILTVTLLSAVLTKISWCTFILALENVKIISGLLII